MSEYEVKRRINEFLDALEDGDPGIFEYKSWLSKNLNREESAGTAEDVMPVVCWQQLVPSNSEEWRSLVLNPLREHQSSYIYHHRPFSKELYEEVRKRISESDEEFKEKLRSPSWKRRSRSRSPSRPPREL